MSAGDIQGLLAVLDPDAVIHIDGASRIAGGSSDAADAPREIRGASRWAAQLIALSRGARFFQLAVINGTVGVVVAPRGKLAQALIFTFKNGKLTRLEAIGEPAHLRELDIAAP